MVVVLVLTKVVKIPKNIFLIREKELFGDDFRCGGADDVRREPSKRIFLGFVAFISKIIAIFVNY